MKENVKKYLLFVAKKAIADELGVTLDESVPRPEEATELDEKRGAFVTLEMGKQLRGCIGNIMPVYPLEEAVRRNAVSAAFEDPRFMPLGVDEFNDIEIEISVLTVPKKLSYKNTDDLLSKLRPLEDGVIVKKSYYEATYLPQVWEDIRDKKNFLSSLCMKAGLNSDEWEKGDVEILTYQAEVF